VVELADAPAELVAKALVNRGFRKGLLGDSQGEIADYTAVTELADAPAEQVARALINRGITKGRLGDSQGAIADYTAAVELAGAPAEQVVRAFVSLTGAFLQVDRLADAVNLVARLHEIEPAGTPVERRLEVRITAIVNAAKQHSLDVAAALLEAALMHDPEDIRDRLGFLKPAIEFARTGSEQVISNLPDRERDAAREIAAKFLEKESRDDHKDTFVSPP
jgi:tetratricopeptide (TPR) repeat protein